MSDVDCPHLGRPMEHPTECTICSGADKRLRDQQAEAPRTFPAKFASQCPECNLPITVGTAISWLPDHPAVHAECWED